jgi:hypothetical protein
MPSFILFPELYSSYMSFHIQLISINSSPVLYDTIRYDTIRYDTIRYDTIYSLIAIGLTPGGSSTVHIYTQTIHRTTQ